jgi:hypothetical protein
MEMDAIGANSSLSVTPVRRKKNGRRMRDRPFTAWNSAAEAAFPMTCVWFLRGQSQGLFLRAE